MKISIITVFPELYDSFLKISLIGRAIEKGLLEFNLVKLSDLCSPKERIDEPVCGPGTGMIIKPEVIAKAIEICQNKWGQGFKIFFSPQGKRLDQNILKTLSKKIFSLKTTQKPEAEKADSGDHIILICSRYEGIDERVQEFYADAVFSVGDYVVMGGDLPAQIFLEAFLRLIPGIVGKQESVEQESFSDAFLDYPEYGLPVEWQGLKIPEIVRSGNHAEIEKWRKEQAAQKTVLKRFDWFASSEPSLQDIQLAKKFIPNHYAALMHTQILVKEGLVGNNSITSLDIHDISRSSATYGIENYFVVTPLQDQQKVLNTFLDFWKSDTGKEYNSSRFEAVSRVVPALNFEDVIAKIKEKEGIAPLVICTSAREVEPEKQIDFFSQGRIFGLKRPILLIFGTGHGLSEEILQKSDFVLNPIKGMTDYNHLSVRSAAAIIFDRWLGLNYRRSVDKDFK
jgi:tRNA (guanine37-N1)-methyltransferase